MKYLTAIPFFGNDPRYVKMLHEWAHQFIKTTGDDNFVIFTDGSTYVKSLEGIGGKIETFDTDHFTPWMREDQPFDVKGALMCEAALYFDKPFLMLDGDALLMKDPSRTLELLGDVSCAMPVDHGAILHGHKFFMDGPKYNDVRKMCAGVFWFGAVRHRARLVSEYKKAWTELLAADFPWTPRIPHLLEQYAWSLAHHRMNGATLPGSMNWAPHIVGPSPYAVVNHYFGHKKWEGKGKAPANV